MAYKWKEIELAYYIAPDGLEYPLFGGKRVLMSFDGLEMPDINYITDSGPFTHGVRVRDYRLQERVIDFILRENGCSRQTRWDNIGEIMDAVRMNRGGEGSILIVLPDGTQRKIGAWIQSGPSGRYEASGGLSPYDLNESLRFLAPYPIWYDPTENQSEYPVTVTESCLDMCLPACLGDGSISTGYIYLNIAINYAGTFAAYPTVVIAGPLSIPIIRNDTTDKEIKLNYIVSNGESVTIALNPYQATVINNAGVDLIGTVDNINDLGSFAIDPEGLNVPDGINDIIVSGANALVGVTAANLFYNDNYLGVPK